MIQLALLPSLAALLTFATVADSTASAGSASVSCPPPFTEAATLRGYSYNGTAPRADYIVCEDLTTPNSTILFSALPTGTTTQADIVLRRRVVPQTVADADSYLGLTKAAVMSASHDVLGAALLAKPGGFTLADVTAAIPPIRNVNGPWTWTASRESAVDVALGPGGDDRSSMGLPTPAVIQFTPLFNETPIAGMTERGRTKSVWDGLVGGHLPVLAFYFPDDVASDQQAPASADGDGSHGKYWEMQVAPVPHGAGNEAPVHIRYQRVEDGKVTIVRYFNNFAQNCESTSINTSEPAAQFFSNLLNQHHYWSDVFAEGAQLQLPQRNDTDGAMLVDQMRHTRIRDMITRNQVRKRLLMRRFILKLIILPRQARDKHRKSCEKEVRFHAGCLAQVRHYPRLRWLREQRLPRGFHGLDDGSAGARTVLIREGRA